MQRWAKAAGAAALVAAGLVGGAVLRPGDSQAQTARGPAAAPVCMISAASDNVAWTLCGTDVHRCVFNGRQVTCT